ncbi:MAG: hypothetical protein LBN71_03435 [Tannerella sp.]|jgi:enamine deaminase RidA (YjgF/YER057c/UK114 family)|nr:hypothetical protein [Tannerella sp.]
MMIHKKIIWPEWSVEAEVRAFLPGEGLPEYHAMIRLTDAACSAQTQFERIEKAAGQLQKQLPDAVPVWKRYFVSDAVNQVPFLNLNQGATAVSIVEQPPLNGTKAAIWMYLAPGVRLSKDSQGATVMEHASYRHLFHTQLHGLANGEAAQTEAFFNQYIRHLAAQGCTLEKHCIRTWIYVQGVDIHYAGMVAARKACFEREGLTPQTHFIASTGIEGRYILPQTLAFMDAYAVQGLQPGQIQYLYAPTHLNPTCEYGVTFERGTAVHYGDRRHVFISGTASINNRGGIEHPMDVVKQAGRMFENIQTLLAEADAGMEDVVYLIVYLRDISDYQVMDSYLKETCPQLPALIVRAPVCRSGWLVEAECMAIKQAADKRFEAF